MTASDGADETEDDKIECGGGMCRKGADEVGVVMEDGMSFI